MAEALIERLRPVIAKAMGWQPTEDGPSYRETHSKLEAEIIAALRARAAEPVAVKALVWRDHSYKDDLLWTASHPYGEYNITREAEEWPYVVRPFLTPQSNYQTFDEAKLAVEADYAQRIRYALAPHGAEPVALLLTHPKFGKELVFADANIDRFTERDWKSASLYTHSAAEQTDAERFAAWASEGPMLAKKAGCYVGIKISPAAPHGGSDAE